MEPADRLTHTVPFDPDTNGDLISRQAHCQRCRVVKARRRQRNRWRTAGQAGGRSVVQREELRLEHLTRRKRLRHRNLHGATGNGAGLDLRLPGRGHRLQANGDVA